MAFQAGKKKQISVVEELGLRKPFQKTPKEDLLTARRMLEELNCVSLLEDLSWDSLVNKWKIHCLIEIDSSNPQLVGKETEWFVFIDDSYPLGKIKFYPAKQNGLTLTFPHQNYNSEGEKELPWRNGDLCLNTNMSLFKRIGMDIEPLDKEHRLFWHFERLIYWLEYASKGELLQEGAPFELPPLPIGIPATVAFCENDRTYYFWKNNDFKYGYLDLIKLDADNKTLLINKFLTYQEILIHKYHWGDYVSNHEKGHIKGAWLLLNEIPILRPWHIPSTWGELISVCHKQNIDLLSIIKQFAPTFRYNGRHILMLGFPISDRIGEKSVQIHWIGLALPELTHQLSMTHGFRNREKAYWWHDQQKLFKKSTEIDWLFTENWDKSELTNRGSFPNDITSKSTLIIGAGAVGSVVSELLVRSGLTQLAIMDEDILKAGNLVRHTLTLNDINKYKVDSLVNRLINCSPHNQIKGINKHFPFFEEGHLEMINQYNVILDCTAEDEVIYQLENFPWSPDKTFISISLGYGSKRLFVYMSHGQSFSAQSFFKLIRPWQEKEAQSLIGIEIPREGIGCWHPVFPARSDDVWQMATIAIKNIEMALQQPIIKPKLLVYEQEWNEEVFLGTRLVSQEEYDER